MTGALALTAYLRDGWRAGASTALATSVLVAALLIGTRDHVARIAFMALLFGISIRALPVAAGIAADLGGLDEIGGSGVGRIVAICSALVVSTLASGAAFGAMLATFARFSLNLSQPFAALGEPGFKHFVRMQVREAADGPGTIDVFVIGAVDPVGKSAPVLVDRFHWRAEIKEEVL